MAEVSAIEWTDATWNPWQGCTKVSPACKNCYMFRDMKRYGRDGSVIVRSAARTFTLPIRRNREGNRVIPPGAKVFTCSWSDWFHEEADDWRDEAWDIIRMRPDVIFQIVTKRSDRIADHLPADWNDGWKNVWLIATAENQHYLDLRMMDLALIPCAVRGLSIEPMLGTVDLEDWKTVIDWVIVGGESGSESRPMNKHWVDVAREQCEDFQIPFFFKQWGDRDPERSQGRLLDGREWNQFPGVSL